MSAFGPIVIEPEKDNSTATPVEWDEELIMTLSDGYHVSQGLCRRMAYLSNKGSRAYRYLGFMRCFVSHRLLNKRSSRV